MIYKLANGRKVNYLNINSKTAKNLEYVDKELEKAGYGYNQRLAILGTIQRESEGNPLAISKNGVWHGLIQWNKDRYRMQSKNEQEELKRQTQLLLKELEKTGWSGQTWRDQLAYSDSFKNAADLNEAMDIFTRRFVRPANIDSEIQKRLVFAQNGWMDIEDPEYDLETAKKVLPKEEIEAWRKDPDNNHLPSGYTDEQGKYHYLKSTQHESYPETRDFERNDPETAKFMSKYFDADDYVSKFPVLSPVMSGLPDNVSGYGTKQDLVYRPFVEKKQYGGLVYESFLYNPKNNNKKDESSNLIYDIPDVSESRYPIEPVSIYKPTERFVSTTTPQETQTETPQTSSNDSVTTTPTPAVVTVPKQKGTIKYKNSNMNLGNLSEFANRLADAGISFTVTSGLRSNAVTKSGNRSRHADGNAIDIVLDISDDEFKKKLNDSPELQKYMRDNKVRLLNENSKEVLQRTGGTGGHWHASIGGERFGQSVWNNVLAYDDDWYAYTGKSKNS